MQPKTQRRSAKMKGDLVLRALAGEDRGELAEKAGASTQELAAWVETFIAGGRAALAGKAAGASLQAEVTTLHAKIGALVVELDKRSASNNGSDEGEED